MPNALVIERDRAAISPSARYRRASRTASMAASYSRWISSTGSAESTRLSRYASCAFCHILVLPTPSHRQIWQLPYASALARLQVLRQLQYVFRRNLRDHVLGLAIDHFDHHTLRLRVFFPRNGRRYLWQIL